MWPNLQETADSAHLLKKSLIENLIFCAVVAIGNNCCKLKKEGEQVGKNVLFFN